MATTPVRPLVLLAAQMAACLVSAAVSTVLVLAVGRIAFDVPLPDQLAGFALGSTLVAFGTSLSPAGGVPVLISGSGWVFFGVMLLFNIVTSMTHEQSAKRAAIIDQLAEANAKLAAALKENAGQSRRPRPAGGGGGGVRARPATP